MKFSYLISTIKKDVGGANWKVPLKFIKKLLLNNSFKLILNYRIGYFCNEKGFDLICKILKHRQIKRFSCQISYSAKIGANLSFPHPIGIVIGDGVLIGDNVKIWQNVTLGSNGKESCGLQYPVIANNVKIFAASMIIGDVNVGKNSTVGGMSLVLNDVKENEVVAGIPAKAIS